MVPLHRGSLVSSVRLSGLSLLKRSLKRTVVTSTVDWKPIKSTRTPNEEESKGKGHGKKIVLGLMFAMPIISFYLGTWQVRRLEWKTKLIAKCESRLAYDPTPLPKRFAPEMCENWEYRRVTLKGTFLHEEEMFVGPRVRNGVKGYILFTPFIRKDTGEKLLIERGWVSEDKAVPTSRSLQHLSLPRGDNVELMCLVRAPHPRGTFQWEKSDKNSRLWQVADIYEMAESSGCPPIHLQAIYDMKDHYWPESNKEIEHDSQASNSTSSRWNFWPQNTAANVNSTDEKSLRFTSEEPDLKDGLEFNEWQFRNAGVPIGKVPKIDLKNNHLQYLVTWYGLSLLSSVFLFVALRKYRKGSGVSQAQVKKDKLRHAKKFM
ncbi:hypothetical protein HG535_0F01370 [Zygotorulaspora mrakii]|uniref:SURF1-like protein n=1 Tax=Zygotorulaspora mrakii TaxID=42260 RepID=A0A7H9B5I2_ZYGMR|nr:uncharacterized protein HG535_0F01370 [Zygotorulaspora mrakii]QLG73626.1 hypothetical protein HG535_0F01370 [Zygotorulaspora mrakii]